MDQINIMENVTKLVDVIKQQAELFIVEGGSFYPFGTCIDKLGEIKPIGAYLEGNDPSPSELISMLEAHFVKGLNNGLFNICAIAIDVSIKEKDKSYDALEIRLFNLEKDDVDKLYYKYKVKGKKVQFTPQEIS
ncbi:hypothetical protein ACFQZI_14790 [Mucilaginibacter lutimaris]|uniref:Uncharacterized protein n=1 Tax=Mucilaginibacter lutimaris TaxID=931629 RepID=A0ABW2ZIT8_9SPHI